MYTVRSMLVVLATVPAIAAPRPTLAQQTDPYVSCVRCHALPMQQAQGALGGHGYGYPPQPEMVCNNCHDTNTLPQPHEQNPSVPPFQPYFWGLGMGYYNSTMTELCLSCHTAFNHVPRATNDVSNHRNDVFPYFDGTSPLTKQLVAPKSVLPLYDFPGSPNQNSYAGGLVCSSCHDPHDPSYVVDSSPKFLRIGTTGSTTRLCDTCHLPTLPAMPDLFISSRSDSVRFQKQTDGSLKIDVKVKNRGNLSSSGGSNSVTWYSETGIPTYVGGFSLPTIQPDVEATVSLSWMPPYGWTGWTEGGFFVFRLPTSPLKINPAYPINEYVRAMNTLPAPSNLFVNQLYSAEIHLMWTPPPTDAGLLTYDVYRDGIKVNPEPITQPWYVDYGLASETPHVYTVTAVQGDLTSAQSYPVGATTMAGNVIRVPYDYPTIQDAIAAAEYGTSIYVAAGTYTEALSFTGKFGVTVKGQDANGCTLETPAGNTTPLILNAYGGVTTDPYGLGGNTLAGFTIKNQSVVMGAGDVLAGCVLWNQTTTPPTAIFGAGGLVAQCVVDSPGPTVYIGQIFAAVNSIFRSANPLQNSNPSSSVLLLNNNFPAWFGWSAYQGSGNFGGLPLFEPPGPPSRYFTEFSSITTGKGLQLKEDWWFAPADVGAFEVYSPYTPKPPANLSASFQTGSRTVRLTWTLSPDDAKRTTNYWIYRSTAPLLPPGPETIPYMTVSRGVAFIEDTDITPGITYYYQVRALGGYDWQYNQPVLSAATNTASSGDLNVPPVAVNDFPTVLEDQSVIIAVLANDTDANGDPLTVVAVTQPLRGSAVINLDNTVAYMPSRDFFGTDTFNYSVTDGRGGFTTAQVSVAVAPVNDPPVAANDSYGTLEDTALVVGAPGVLANDTDVDSVLFGVVLDRGPAHGTMTLNPVGSVTYTPAANYHGTDSFTYLAYESQSASNVATVTITVTAVNDKPVANSQTLPVTEDVPAAVTLAAMDADNNPLTYLVTSGPAHGVLSGTAPNLTYTPALNSTMGDSFTFVANDGTVDSDPATVTITMTAVNDKPVADDKPVTTDEDTDVAVTLTATDADGNPLTYTVMTVPTKGTITGATPNLTYKPATNDSGVYSFTFVANDGTVDSNVATVTITVDPVNDAPVAANDGTYSTLEDTNLVVGAPGVLVNDTDIDSVTLSAVLVTGPAHGALTLDAVGAFTYTPALNYFGPDSFTYRASDGQATSDVVTVAITVTSVNDAPVANAGPDKSVKVNTNTTFNGSGSTDVDGTIVSYSWNFGDRTTATGMTVTKRYKKTGTYTVTLTIMDNLGATSTDTARVTITK